MLTRWSGVPLYGLYRGLCFSNVRYAQRMCLVVNIFTRENENRLCNHVSVPRPAHGVGLDGVLSFFE